MDNSELKIIKLYGIERGFLKYLPSSILAVRDVDSLLKDIFISAQKVTFVEGYPCLHKEELQSRIHLRVIKELGSKCVICEESFKKGIHVHHIKHYWRTLNNVFGFTVLCSICHKKAHRGLAITDSELRDICEDISRCGSRLYDSPWGEEYPENSVVRIPHTQYYYSPILGDRVKE